MAIANLHQTLLFCTTEKNDLLNEIEHLTTQKSFMLDVAANDSRLLTAEKSALNSKFRKIFENSEEYQEDYQSYTEIPEFEVALDKILAEITEHQQETAMAETVFDEQITTCDTEIKEIEAYEESFKSQLTSNISKDFNLSLGG
ncbi:MAG: hypothetical protein MJ237_02970 [bacterium]|nr:hypothetical protein [bacterium]